MDMLIFRRKTEEEIVAENENMQANVNIEEITVD